MKETVNSELLTESVFPLIVSVYGIGSINYNVNIETVEPWSEDVAKHNNVIKKRRMLGSTAPNEKNIIDKKSFIKLVQMERQLMEDFGVHAASLYGFDKPIDVQLQRCALVIYLAKCWEDWAMKMYQMFNTTDPAAAEKQFKYVYVQYAIPYYENAIECLKIIGNFLPPDISPNQKQAWGKMFLYAKSKYLETISLYGDEKWNTITQKHYLNADSILVNNGMGHLVPDYHPESEQEHGMLDGVKNLIWSVWYNMCGSEHNQEKPKYTPLRTQATDSMTRDGNNVNVKNPGVVKKKI